MDGKLHFGKHWMRLEGDILYCKYTGLISVPDVRESMQLLDKMLVPGRTYYIIADVADVTGMEAEARRISTEWFATHNIGGAVNFGAGAVTRAIAALILSMLRLLHRNHMSSEFVKTEEEARAWVEAQRRRRSAASPSR